MENKILIVTFLGFFKGKFCIYLNGVLCYYDFTSNFDGDVVQHKLNRLKDNLEFHGLKYTVENLKIQKKDLTIDINHPPFLLDVLLSILK